MFIRIDEAMEIGGTHLSNDLVSWRAPPLGSVD